MNRREVIVGLDIGSVKVCAAIAEVTDDGVLEIIGVGESESKGLRKGVVVDLNAAVKSIVDAVNKAELMAGRIVKSAVVGVAGIHISSENSSGVVAVSRSGMEITDDDIERVLDAAKVIPIPQDREILHVIPREYIVDGCSGIRCPAGMAGIRLEVKTHIITGSITSIRNVTKIVQRSGLTVDDRVLQSLAAGEGVLSENEKELGVILLDIGGGTTDIAVYSEGSIRHTAVVPIGGCSITNDIAVGLRLPVNYAETLKRFYGAASPEDIEENGIVELDIAGRSTPQKVDLKILAGIIESRVDEIFEYIESEIGKTFNEGMMPAGVVLTGGGAKLKGIVDKAVERLDLPVRVGVPTGVSGMADVVGSPDYAVAVGLIKYGRELLYPVIPEGRKESGGAGGIFEAIKDWLERLISA